MTTEYKIEIINAIAGDGGALSRYIPNYEVRPAQIKGMLLAWNALEKGENFILEGPCGYGKSATYLIASILCAIHQRKRVVITTAGITLQEQVFYKDIPMILRAIMEVSKEVVSCAYLKGRNNFACSRKIQDRAFEISKNTVMENKDEISKLVTWAKCSRAGDSSELDYVPSYNVWKEVACLDSDECEGKDCGYFDGCFYYNLRERAQNANVIVCNYHVLFTNAQIGGMLLGAYDILVCDEAHEMAKIARDFLEVKVSYHTFHNFQQDIAKLANMVDNFRSSMCDPVPLLAAAKQFFEELTQAHQTKGEERIKLLGHGTPIEHKHFCEEIQDFEQRIRSARIDFIEDDDDRREHRGHESSPLAKRLEKIADKVNLAARNVKDICTQADKQRSYWLEMEKNNLLSLRSKPIKVDEYLNENFFGGSKATIVTSATLSVNESFDFIKTELGITQASEYLAPSPFDLEKQQLWFLHPDAVEGNSKEFSDKLIPNLKDIIKATGGGCLCLFTSNYNLNTAARELRRIFPRMTILKQGDAPRHALLKAFNDEMDSVLCATKSFFVGVDVPGPSLRCVIIDKFPFESPNDPVMSVLSNLPNGFAKYMIPDMVIALKQAVGRGVRNKSDMCVIAILDNRLATARYKNQVAFSFNYDKTATRDLADVKNYIDSYLSSAPNAQIKKK